MYRKALTSTLVVFALMLSFAVLPACSTTSSQDSSSGSSSAQNSDANASSSKDMYSGDELKTFFTDLESMAVMMEQSAKIASNNSFSQGLPTSSYEVLGTFDSFLFYQGTFDGKEFSKMGADDQARALELIQRYESALAQSDPDYAAKMNQYVKDGFQTTLNYKL